MARNTPTEEDMDRWVEMLDSPDITDRNTFDNEWDKYFEDTHIKSRTDLREDTFNKLSKLRPDIRAEKIVKIKKSVSAEKERKLRYTARVKRKIVRAEQTYVVRKGKREVRYRDRFGRFASVKKKK